MKKVLLFSIICFSIYILPVFAYQTILIRYPDGELWQKAYYKKIGNQAILQYTPKGETSNNWVRSIVIHSYNDAVYPLNSFVENSAGKMMKINPTGKYKTIKKHNDDVILTRCTENYKNIQGQCEFLRITRMHEGTATIHYMNKNKDDFKSNYTIWYEIIKRAKFYNSYYRDERILDKSEFFEL